MQYLRIACSRKAFIMAAAMACLMQSPALAQDTRLSQPAESTGNDIHNEYCNVYSSYAQTDDEFCGDWVGTYTHETWDKETSEKEGGFKTKTVVERVYIRIENIKGIHTIRIKSKENGNPDFRYWRECQSVRMEAGKLYFTMLFSNTIDVYNGERINGQIVKSTCIYSDVILSLTNNYITYSDSNRMEYFGSNRQLIGKDTTPFKELFVLYRDDGW